MAYDFPAAPTPGQTFNNYVWDGEKWKLQSPQVAGAVRYDTAQSLNEPQKGQARTNIGASSGKKNYIINGAMQVSQENGATAGTATGYYPADQFRTSFTGTTGVVSVGINGTVSTSGSRNRIRATVTTADATMSAGDYYTIFQPIEGYRCSDLMSGTATAKTITIQFGVKAPAGTYCVRLCNAAVDRSYAAEYVISAGEANTDVVKSVTLTLDITGTWQYSDLAGMYIMWILMAGTTYQGAANTWLAGNIYASASQFNFLGTNGNVFELFDVSLTEGTVAPPFQVPDYADELALCQRYFYRRDMQAGVWFAVLQAYSTTAASGPIMDFPVRMRAAPAVQTGGTPPWISNATGVSGVINAGSYLATNDFLMGMALGGAVFRAGDAVMVGTPNGSAYYLLNARL